MSLPLNGISEIQQDRLVDVCGLAISEDWPVAEAIDVYALAINTLLLGRVLSEREPTQRMTMKEYEDFRREWSRLAIEAVSALNPDIIPVECAERLDSLGKFLDGGGAQ